MKFVTSYGPAMWEVYAERFLDTWEEYWPGELVVYTEVPAPKQFSERVKVKSLFEDTDCAKYLDVINPWPSLKGVVNGKRYYQWDHFKFCRKFFAQYDAYKDYEGLLFWLDADIVTFEKVPEDLLRGFLKGVAMCYLGRSDWHSCASFIGWNTHHGDCKKYFETMMHLHVSGDFMHLPEWHDSFLNDVIRENGKISARNLTADITTSGPANIFDLSPLGAYAKHLKGNLKWKEKDDKNDASFVPH